MPLSRLRSLAWPAAATLTVAGTMFAAGLLTPPAAEADEGEYIRPVSDPVVMTECGACHMAFPAGLLPARSWQAVMADLGNHFGENAGLDEATTKHITDYLVANAADAGGKRSRMLRGVGADAIPLRITEMPWWVREHNGEVRPGAFEDPRVGSKANCVACHRGADKGYFEDD